MDRGIVKLSATGLVVVAFAGLSLLLLAPGTAADTRSLGAADFDSALTSFASLALVALSTWILTCVVLASLARHAAWALLLSRATTPLFLRRALYLGAAGALAVGPVAASGPSVQGPEGHGTTSTARILDGLRLPDRPVGQTPAPAGDYSAATPQATYTVRAGDTLWAIASRDLDPTVSPMVVAAAMRRWYAANRGVIGADPNLIFPDQQLARPTPDPPTKDTR